MLKHIGAGRQRAKGGIRWGTDSGHRWQRPPLRRRGKRLRREDVELRTRSKGKHASENKQGWRLGKSSGHSERRRREATKIREYRIESGDRGQSRKQRESTASKNRHRELLGHRVGHRAGLRVEHRAGLRHRELLGHRAGLRSFLDHAAENHMLDGKDGKSFFKATKLCDIWSLIHRTLTCPDAEGEDKSNKDRLVVKKSFNTPIGVHGFTQANCYTVKVVYDQLKQRPITAYPIHP